MLLSQLAICGLFHPKMTLDLKSCTNNIHLFWLFCQLHQILASYITRVCCQSQEINFKFLSGLSLPSAGIEPVLPPHPAILLTNIETSYKCHQLSPSFFSSWSCFPCCLWDSSLMFIDFYRRIFVGKALGLNFMNGDSVWICLALFFV